MSVPGGAVSRFTGLTSQLLGQSLGYGTGSALAATLTPIIQPLANETWSQFPTIPLPVALAAALSLEHPDLEGTMANEARQQGFNGDRFRWFIDATDTAPELAAALDLWRRGLIGREDVVFSLRKAHIPERWHEALLGLRRQFLSPADLGQLRQQGFIEQGEQHAGSAIFGVEPADAEHIFEISGLPPGLETMVQLWRRGKIDTARLEQSIREGNVKTKYIPDLLNLRYLPPSPAVAAEAVLKQQIPRERGREIAALSGIDAETFDLMSRVNGRPIATGQAMDLIRRGLRGPDFLREVVARSDVRVEYTDDILALRERLLPLFQVLRLLRDGTLTDDEATRQLSMQGYGPTLVQAIVAGGHARKTQGTKDLVASQVALLYEAGFETREWATGALTALGYDPDEADLYLLIPESRRLIAYLNAVVARIKSSYVGHKIDLNTALGELEAAGIQPDERQAYTDLWEAEREANVRRLTQAQVAKLVKIGLMSPAEGKTRFVDMGYPDADADWLLRLIPHPEAVAPSPVS